jgi:hypothetical protein
MVLVQFTLTYDDIVGNTPKTGQNITITAVGTGTQSFNNPATVLVPVNLNSGTYRAKVAGLEIASGVVNTTTFAFQPQLLVLSSSAFQFPKNGQQGLYFSNNGQFCQSDVKGNREFRIHFGNGQIDLNLSINQFGTFAGVQATAPWALAPNSTWATAQFAYMILTLDVESDNEQFPIYDRK